jgi:hypothetical protein
MFLGPKNYRSDVVNTDSSGIRLSVDQRGAFGIDDIGREPCSLLVGNSVALGAGATSDSATISSQLSLHGERWVNLTGWAYSGWQELILFLAYRDRFPNIRRVVILSGLNDLYLSFTPRLFDPTVGPFYFSDRFRQGVADASSPGRFELIKRLFRGHSKPPTLDIETDVENRWKQRDTIMLPIKKTLSAWADLARGAKFDLLYALQPIAPFIERSPVSKEQELISYHDSIQSPRKNLLRLALTEDRYYWYRSSLLRVCKENNIQFTDLNRLFPNDGWNFVDRIHLTDRGQRITSDLIQAEIKRIFR